MSPTYQTSPSNKPFNMFSRILDYTVYTIKSEVNTTMAFWRPPPIVSFIARVLERQIKQ